MRCNQCGTTNDADAGFCETCGAALKTMNCPKCSKENDADSKFCIHCGESFISNICSACGKENHPGSKFCKSCGQALGKGNAPAATVRERQTVNRKGLPGWAWVLISTLVLGLIAGALFLFKPWERLPASLGGPALALPEGGTSAPASSPTIRPTNTFVSTATSDPYITWLLTTGLNLSSPRIVSVETFDEWDDAGWSYSEDVSIVGDASGKSIQMVGKHTFSTWLVAPPIDPGNGVLTKFMLSGTTVEFFLDQNDWATSAYRRFGGGFYDSDRMVTTIWEGTDGHLSEENMDGTLIFHSGQWYGLFIGVDPAGNFRFVTWNWDDPDQFVWHDFYGGNDWKQGQWQFDVQVDEGTVMLDDLHVIAFNSLQGNTATPTRTPTRRPSGSGGSGGTVDTPVPPPDQGGGDTGGQPPIVGVITVYPWNVPAAGNYHIVLCGCIPGTFVDIHFNLYPGGEQLYAPQTAIIDGGGCWTSPIWANPGLNTQVLVEAYYNGVSIGSAIFIME